ncbi:MAG: bifunctional 4-hydroxy-2-oxoglutarate aldolase/2-dehydro-3-deoxy-phosphogluconate aldolase [Pseudomonadota bacterium]
MAAEQDVQAVRKVMTAAPVIPVLTIERVEDAVPLAQALVDGGLPAIEITLRTDAALEAIRRVAAEVEGAIPGAGTVLTPQQVADCEAAGCKFLVSPGASAALLNAVANHSVSLLPGAATASEVMALGERGYECLKFFPAGPAGGPSYLKGLAGPLPGFTFCPTGGVSQNNALDYLALPNVACVGGSWVAPKKLIDARAWGEITQLAAAASKISAG